MTTLTLPNENRTLSTPQAITDFLAERGVGFAQWQAAQPLNPTDTDAAILAAYEHELTPYMNANGYQSADVVNIHSQTPNLETLRRKFLNEHTHSEDEVRFFVSGQGDFWFHLEGPRNPFGDEIFCLTCTAGDLLSVPAGVKHWFDFMPADGRMPQVTVIRMFSDPDGWTPNYTYSGVEGAYGGILSQERLEVTV